jgi:threonine dehydrogenase-like Zn-dependent dehydrogenase
MKAVNYQGAFKVKVEDVPKPQIEHPDDVVVKVTTAGEFGQRLPFGQDGGGFAD